LYHCKLDGNELIVTEIMTRLTTGAVIGLSLMTLTTMFLYRFAARSQQQQTFAEPDQLGVTFSIIFWILGWLIFHVQCGEDIFPRLVASEFVSLNVGVGLHMISTDGLGSLARCILDSLWIAYAAMVAVALYAEPWDEETAAVPPTEPKAIVLDLADVEQKLERIQARIDRIKAAAKAQ